MPARNYKETAVFQIEKDTSASRSFQEQSSPKLTKSPSLQRVSAIHVLRGPDVTFNSQESPKNQSPPAEKLLENGDAADKIPSIRRQDSFEMRLPQLPKIDVHPTQTQTNSSNPESPVSPLLTSDPKSERSHSQTFSRPHSQYDDMAIKTKEAMDARKREAPPFWRLVELSLAEWLYAVLGSIGAAIFGAFNPLLAYVIALVVTAYYRIDETHPLRQEVDKWCLIIACMGIVTVVANFLQHFYFGIMGEKMTERVRRMMFSGNGSSSLCNEYFLYLDILYIYLSHQDNYFSTPMVWKIISERIRCLFYSCNHWYNCLYSLKFHTTNYHFVETKTLEELNHHIDHFIF